MRENNFANQEENVIGTRGLGRDFSFQDVRDVVNQYRSEMGIFRRVFWMHPALKVAETISLTQGGQNLLTNEEKYTLARRFFVVNPVKYGNASYRAMESLFSECVWQIFRALARANLLTFANFESLVAYDRQFSAKLSDLFHCLNHLQNNHFLTQETFSLLLQNPERVPDRQILFDILYANDFSAAVVNVVFTHPDPQGLARIYQFLFANQDGEMPHFPQEIRQLMLQSTGSINCLNTVLQTLHEAHLLNVQTLRELLDPVHAYILSEDALGQILSRLPSHVLNQEVWSEILRLTRENPPERGINGHLEIAPLTDYVRELLLNADENQLPPQEIPRLVTREEENLRFALNLRGMYDVIPHLEVMLEGFFQNQQGEQMQNFMEQLDLIQEAQNERWRLMIEQHDELENENRLRNLQNDNPLLQHILALDRENIGHVANAPRPPAPAAPFNQGQNTHTASVHKSASESAFKLKADYGKELLKKGLENILKIFKEYVFSLSDESEKNRAAKRCVNRIFKSSYFFKDPESEVNTRELFAVIWLAIHDDNRRMASLEDALDLVTEGLYEIQRGYNLSAEGVDNGEKSDMSICVAGTFNKIIEKMDGVLRDLKIIFMTKETASLKFPIVVREEVGNFLKSLDSKMRAECVEKLKSDGTPGPIWGEIRFKVATRIFEEFRLIFVSEENEQEEQAFINFLQMGECDVTHNKLKSFLEFIEAGQYVELKDLAILNSADSSPNLSQNRSGLIAAPKPENNEDSENNNNNNLPFGN